MSDGLKLAIVGAAADKFDANTEATARQLISEWIQDYSPSEVISGGCHLGGVDAWAIEYADFMGVPSRIYLPKERKWSTGYRLRNIQIAQAADKVLCIAVRTFPKDYQGLRFPYCYHCRPTKRRDQHIKSGGCWTCKFARSLDKPASTVIIGEYEDDHDSETDEGMLGPLSG